MSVKKKAVLLVDIGTPLEPTKESVQKYLMQFLGDPFVITGPNWVREIIFKKIIIPLRASKSLLKYKKIWTQLGAPMRVELNEIVLELQKRLNSNSTSGDSEWHCYFAFHYGGPLLPEVMEQIKKDGMNELIIFPLYPQWALSTRGCLEDQIQKLMISSSPLNNYSLERFSISPIFYHHEGFINAQVDQIKPFLNQNSSVNEGERAIVFSFHGVPERHLKSVVSSCGKCLKRGGECRPLEIAKNYCYRYQCIETARLIASQLGLNHWDVAFQSRFGPTRWLEPSLFEVIEHLLELNIKRVLICSPCFVVDGLETLEEVGMEMRDYFLKRGGEEFILVPSLNHSDSWMKVLTSMIQKETPQ